MNDELERLMREASPQPWYYPDDGGHLIYGQRGLSGVAGVFPGSRADPKPSRANAALIVAAVNALPELLAERAENARLREALQPFIRSEDDFKGAPDNAPYGVYVKIRDLRRARAALNQETKP